MTFWDHLDELRKTLWHSLLAVLAVSVVAFCFKDILFKIVLGPVPENLNLINLEVAGQFMVHMKVALLFGFTASIPYIIWEIWKFIAPALYSHEKRGVGRVFLLSSFFFYFGVVVGYFILLPVCLKFFHGYIVSDLVSNTFSLQSYMSLFNSLVVVLGLVFEFPLLILLLNKLGILGLDTLKQGRRYAIVAVMILAALITPADLASMFIVAIPLYGLYESSILLVRIQ